MGKRQLYVIIDMLHNRFKTHMIPYHAWALILPLGRQPAEFLAADYIHNRSDDAKSFWLAWRLSLTLVQQNQKIEFKIERDGSNINLFASIENKRLGALTFNLERSIIEFECNDRHVEFIIDEDELVVSGNVSEFVEDNHHNSTLNPIGNWKKDGYRRGVGVNSSWKIKTTECYSDVGSYAQAIIAHSANNERFAIVERNSQTHALKEITINYDGGSWMLYALNEQHMQVTITSSEDTENTSCVPLVFDINRQYVGYGYPVPEL